jgi:hypothetical protein
LQRVLDERSCWHIATKRLVVLVLLGFKDFRHSIKRARSALNRKVPVSWRQLLEKRENWTG